MKSVTVVIVAFGDQPLLPAAVHAAISSRHVSVEVVLVDNGCTDGGVDAVRGIAGVTVVEPGHNLGLDAACDIGIAAGSGEFVALVNSDAVARDDAIEALVSVAEDSTVGIATASLRLHEEPDRMNSSGNEIHFLGFSWCGGLNEPATRFTTPRDVASASGAAMVMRRELWDAMGGFPAEFFMYYEDAELSMRCWQAGYRVVFVPDAVVTHHYESGRNKSKMYYAERNRLITMLTHPEARSLALLMPAMIAVEFAIVVLAWHQGWAAAKVKGWWWLVRHRRWVRARRTAIQSERVVGDALIAPLLATRLMNGNIDLPPALEPLDTALAFYWKVVRALLRQAR